MRFKSGDAATVGWMTKRGDWAITEAGIEALEQLSDADRSVSRAANALPRDHQRRKQAQQDLSEVHQFIAETLRLVDAGMPGPPTRISPTLRAVLLPRLLISWPAAA